MLGIPKLEEFAMMLLQSDSRIAVGYEKLRISMRDEFTSAAFNHRGIFRNEEVFSYSTVSLTLPGPAWP